MTIMWKYLPIISWNLEKDANKLNLNSLLLFFYFFFWLLYDETNK